MINIRPSAWYNQDVDYPTSSVIFGSAPASSKNLINSVPPFLAADANGVLPHEVPFGSAPAYRKCNAETSIR